MSDHHDKPSWLEQNENYVRVLYVACAISCLAGIPFATHGHYWFEKFVFHAIYGFIGCVVLVLVAKWMRTFLMRDEDYYDREELRDRQSDENSEGGSQ